MEAEKWNKPPPPHSPQKTKKKKQENSLPLNLKAYAKIQALLKEKKLHPKKIT